MKYIKGLFLGLMVAAVALQALPISVLAQASAQETSDDPRDGSFQLVPCDGVASDGGVECDFNQLVRMFDRIVRFLLYLSVPLVLGIIMWTAFKYMTANGDPGKLADAKKMLIPVALGLFWVLGSWVTVRFFLDNLLADYINGEAKDTFLDGFLRD